MFNSARQIETIQSNLAADITHALLRPSMYVGDVPCAPMALDTMLYALCRVWASITGQCSELHRLADEAYNSAPSEVETVDSVVQRWHRIAQELRIPMYSGPAKEGERDRRLANRQNSRH